MAPHSKRGWNLRSLDLESDRTLWQLSHPVPPAERGLGVTKSAHQPHVLGGSCCARRVELQLCTAIIEAEIGQPLHAPLSRRLFFLFVQAKGSVIFFFFYTLLSQWEFLTWEIQVAFLK